MGEERTGSYHPLQVTRGSQERRDVMSFLHGAKTASGGTLAGRARHPNVRTHTHTNTHTHRYILLYMEKHTHPSADFGVSAVRLRQIGTLTVWLKQSFWPTLNGF